MIDVSQARCNDSDIKSVSGMVQGGTARLNVLGEKLDLHLINALSHGQGVNKGGDKTRELRSTF